MTRLWWVLPLLMGGCSKGYTENAVGPMGSFDLTPDSPDQRIAITVHIGEPGLPRRSQPAIARVELNLKAQHYVDTCPPNRECTHQIIVDAEGLASFGPLSLEHGGAAEGTASAGDLFADCPPRQACSQRFEFDLALIGDDLVEVQAFANADYKVFKRSDPKLGPIRVDLELEGVPD